MPALKSADEERLTHIEKNLDSLAGYHPGGMVCIERNGRPWRIATLAAIDGQQATIRNGFVYDRATGKRLIPEAPSKDEMRPLTRERLEYLMVLEFVDRISKLRPSVLRKEHVLRLAPLARSYNGIRDDLGLDPVTITSTPQGKTNDKRVG